MRPPDACWLVCEFLQGGTLATWLHGPRGARAAPARPLPARLAAALDVARGMQALEQHSPPILHRCVGATPPAACRLGCPCPTPACTQRDRT